MKAIVWHGPRRMAIEERPEPDDPGAGELIVRPEAVGICGSEVEGYLGHMGNRTPPLVMGHEFAGVVVAAGDGAGAWDGARVAVNPLAGCGHCRLCRAGQENLCPRRTLIGVHHDGAFADLVTAPAANVRALPDGVEARVGALVEPLANGVHAVRLGLAGDPVSRAVVLGAGTIGLMTLQAALLSGIEHVAVLEPHAQRRERALALGAHAAFGDADEALDAVRAASEGLGADLVLDAVGAQATRAMALALLRPGGAGGLHRPGRRRHDAGLPRHRARAARAARLLRLHDGRLRAGARVAGRRARVDGRAGAVRPLEDGPDAFARLAEGPPPAAVKVFLAGAGREAVSMAALEGRTALVTGASSGIGLATALAFADAGAHVHAAARRPELIEEAAVGRDIVAHHLDVTDRAAVAALAARLAGEGPLHALVAAAGTNLKARRLEQLTPAAFDDLIALNLTGAFNVVSALLEPLRATRGDVVLIGSVSGSWPDRSGATYQASKAAILAFARGAAFEEEHGRALHHDHARPRRHGDPRPAPRAPQRRAARADAAPRRRRRRLPVRRLAAAARARRRAHDPAHRPAGAGPDGLSERGGPADARRPQADGPSVGHAERGVGRARDGRAAAELAATRPAP